MQTSTSQSKLRVGVIGGGVGGATIALRLSEQGANVVLFEKETSLVNGPPMCHLHAGGNLYREISDQQCFDLLKQSISTVRVYKDAIDYRPTIVSVPVIDNGEPTDVIERLEKLQAEYAKLIASDPENKVLGEIADYFTLFEREDIERLATKPTPSSPQSSEQWMIAFAKNVDLDQLKFPLILVQEYGISVFRLAAITSLALERSKNCQLLTNTAVTSVNHDDTNKVWQIEARQHNQQTEKYEVDYLINACGFQTGKIDDMVGALPKRMVEFKAAYVSHWSSDHNNWPEVIFYGARGTKNGMTQLTPYPSGYFQIHAMTPEITLFKDGLVASKPESAQPDLPNKFIDKVNSAWDPNVVNSRTNKAIKKVAGFIPTFENATVGGPPMFGAQQIPGDDPTLRVADIAFQKDGYARCEIVKASSALPAANTIVEHLLNTGLLHQTDSMTQPWLTQKLSEQQINERAEALAIERNFPKEMAGRTRPNC